MNSRPWVLLGIGLLAAALTACSGSDVPESEQAALDSPVAQAAVATLDAGSADFVTEIELDGIAGASGTAKLAGVINFDSGAFQADITSDVGEQQASGEIISIGDQVHVRQGQEAWKLEDPEQQSVLPSPAVILEALVKAPKPTAEATGEINGQPVTKYDVVFGDDSAATEPSPAETTGGVGSLFSGQMQAVVWVDDSGRIIQANISPGAETASLFPFAISVEISNFGVEANIAQPKIG